MITILSPRMAYLETGRQKKTTTTDATLVRRQLFKQTSSGSSRARCLIALGARRRRRFHAANSLRNDNVEGNVKCPSSTREDLNSQRSSEHFLAIKVDFLTNNVDLRT